MKIDIPALLLHLRAITPHPPVERLAFRAWRTAMSSLPLYRLGSWLAGRLHRLGAHVLPPIRAWTRGRELPTPKRHTFRELWRRGL